MSRGAKFLAALLVAVVVWVAAAEIMNEAVRYTIPDSIEGFEPDPLLPPGESPGGWTYDRYGVGFIEPGNDRTGAAVTVSTYSLVVFRQLFAYLLVPPGPSFPNRELRIDSPVLDGIGIGDDAIQCGDGQPDACSGWLYWSEVGDQVLTVTFVVDLLEGLMAPDEFRDLVRLAFSS